MADNEDKEISISNFSEYELETLKGLFHLVEQVGFLKYNSYLNFKATIFSALTQQSPELSDEELVEATERIVKLLDKQPDSVVESNIETTTSNEAIQDELISK